MGIQFLALPNAIRMGAQAGQALTATVKSLWAPTAVATTGLTLNHLNQNSLPLAKNEAPGTRRLEVIAPHHNPAADLPQTQRTGKLNFQAQQALPADHVSNFLGWGRKGGDTSPQNNPPPSGNNGNPGPDWKGIATKTAVGVVGSDYLSHILTGEGIATHLRDLMGSDVSDRHRIVLSGSEQKTPLSLTIHAGQVAQIGAFLFPQTKVVADINVQTGGSLKVNRSATVYGALTVEPDGAAHVDGNIVGELLSQGQQNAIDNQGGQITIGSSSIVQGQVANNRLNGLIIGFGEFHGALKNSGAFILHGKFNGQIENTTSGRVILKAGAEVNNRKIHSDAIINSETTVR